MLRVRQRRFDFVESEKYFCEYSGVDEQTGCPLCCVCGLFLDLFGSDCSLTLLIVDLDEVLFLCEE